MTGAPIRPRFGTLRGLSAASLGVLIAGLIVVAVYSSVEAMGNPGYSIVDGYWQGRLPWMGIAETLIVSGATASAVIGATTAFWFGGSWRRILVIPPLLPIGLWWLLAVSGFPGGHPCLPSPCPPQPIDPWAFAYSGPTQALLLLLLPSALIGLLALTARRTAGVSAPT
jgi:hypothetical protein